MAPTRLTLSKLLLALVILSLAALNAVDANAATKVRAATPVSLDALATALVGSPMTVECFADRDDYAGYVILEQPGVIHLDGSACGALRNALAPTPRTLRWLDHGGFYPLGTAAQILTHEATHLLLNSADEGLVECTAVRNVWNTIRLLNLPRDIEAAVYYGATSSHESIHEAPYRSVC